MFYVYFDISTGEINRVSNELQDDLHYVEIDKELYIQFSNGDRNFNEYRVIPTPKDASKFELIEKTTTSIEFDVDRSIHEIQKQNSLVDDEDVFVIVQDKKNNVWKAHAKLNDNYITFLSQTNNYYSQHKEVYVTEENNPNVLLDVLKIPMEGFLKDIDFDVVFNDSKLTTRSDISLYCATVHERYMHEIRE